MSTPPEPAPARGGLSSLASFVAGFGTCLVAMSAFSASTPTNAARDFWASFSADVMVGPPLSSKASTGTDGCPACPAAAACPACPACTDTVCPEAPKCPATSAYPTPAASCAACAPCPDIPKCPEAPKCPDPPKCPACPGAGAAPAAPGAFDAALSAVPPFVFVSYPGDGGDAHAALPPQWADPPATLEDYIGRTHGRIPGCPDGAPHCMLSPLPALLLERMAFLITTGSALKDRAQAQKATWARGLPHITWYSDEADPSLPAVAVPRARGDHQGSTVKYTWALWKQCNDEATYKAMREGALDWLVQADDDTYIFTEQLALTMASFSPNRPAYYGRGMVVGETQYASGGAGYVVSRAGMLRFCERYGPNEASVFPENLFAPEWSDVTIGHMFNTLGLEFIQIDGFHPGAPGGDYLTFEPVPGNMLKPNWGQRSRLPVTYHYVGPPDMARLWRDWAPVRWQTLGGGPVPDAEARRLRRVAEAAGAAAGNGTASCGSSFYVKE